jgi:hypothetical protein
MCKHVCACVEAVILYSIFFLLCTTTLGEFWPSQRWPSIWGDILYSIQFIYCMTSEVLEEVTLTKSVFWYVTRWSSKFQWIVVKFLPYYTASQASRVPYFPAYSAHLTYNAHPKLFCIPFEVQITCTTFLTLCMYLCTDHLVIYGQLENCTLTFFVSIGPER